MRSVALTRLQRRRMERLAQLAGRTPRSMLRIVLRDGFDATERDVRETIAAGEEIDRRGAIPHRKVMTQARARIESHAARNVPRSATVLRLP